MDKLIDDFLNDISEAAVAAPLAAPIVPQNSKVMVAPRAAVQPSQAQPAQAAAKAAGTVVPAKTGAALTQQQMLNPQTVSGMLDALAKNPAFAKNIAASSGIDIKNPINNNIIANTQKTLQAQLEKLRQELLNSTKKAL
jgi:hypothetical protein